MRKVVAVLVLLMTVLFSGCEYFDNTPGSFHIKFEWNEADKPDFSSKDYYAWVLLEEWPEGDREKAVLLMQTAATPFSKTGKVSIDLSDIKYGENKVIKVEIRGSEKSADRVLYFGRSELFSFSSSDRDKEVKVALQTTATPGTGDDENRFNLKIIQNGNVVSKINNTEVTVRINVVQGNRVILANSLSILEKYLNDKKSVTEGFADKAVSELKVFEGNYYDLENWELNFGLEIAEDAGGERIVYGKLLNDDGYMSETVQVSVVVDKTAPGIINPAVTPNPAKLGDIVTAVFSFTEPVDAEKLDLNWDGLNFAESESVTENVFTYTFKVDENTEERNYTLEGRAYDEIGNGPVTFTIGALTVDRTLPSISDETVSVTDDKSAIRTGDTVTVTFKVSEELEKEPEVTVDGKKFKRVGDSADPYTFSYTVSDTDIEGIKTVLVSLSDLARNQNVVEMEQPVKFDLSAPEVINPTVTPAGEPGNAGIGTKIEVRFNISEPVTELKFLVNGEDSELFNQTVSGLTYSYSRTVENNESASQYVFSVSAVDAAGNTLEPYTLGTVDIDVGMPSVLAQTLSKTNVKLLEVFTLDLEFSEELKSLTVLVGSKDISSGCVKSATDLKKYNCTHTANADSDEGDGVKQFSVQMTDMSGNSSTVQLKKTGGSPLTIEYDVTPPAVVNPVIAPSKANSDSTVDVRFSFTEDVENVVMAWDGLEFIRDNSESDKKLFIYKHKVVPADEEKSYTIKILEAFDIAGNPISSEIEIGTVEIDNTPPEIFNTVIKVSDDPLRTFVLENEVISISFEVKEDLSDYAVRIGLKKLSVCINEDITGGKRYTCTYSTPSSVDGEGTKDVTVEVKDPAGNGTSYAVGQLTYDMSDPQLSSAIVIPERVSSSHSEVKVQFSFSEDVQINVDEVYVAAENFGPELILNCNTGSGYTKQYTCTYSFLESDTRVENYDVSVDLMDAAGNKVTGMFIGKIESDREKPYLSVQNISPVAVRQNEQFTVTFTVNEELAAKPVVKIGDKQIDESSCAGSINYTCQHKANEDGDETDGVKSVTVSLRDPAGNTNIVNLSQTVTYDATRPELLNPVIIPEGTANRYNSKIQVRFSFSEKIDYPASFSFTAESSNSLPVPEFVCTPSNENHQSFSCEGSYETSDTSVDTLTFKVAAKDIAGNALTVDESPDIVGTLKVDRENPVASYTSITPENIIKSTASVTVVFDVSEDTAEPPVVNLGELVKTVPDNLDGNSYTYIFNDFSMLSDGDVIVSVSLTDIAGNINSSPYSGNVTADRTVPSVISKTIAPTIANMNTESVTVNFTFNEKVDSFSKNDVTMLPSGILTDYACSNSSGDEQNYSCVFSMSTVGTYEGLLTFSVEAVDKAGNAMVPNPVELGTLTIDTIAPELTFDSITPLTVNEDAASVTAVFTVDKVPFGNPVVRINSEKTMDVPTDVTNEGKTFTYTFTDLSGITDGNKNIYVELKDDSGNSFEGISAEQILFDRSAPTVVSKNVAPAVANSDTDQIVVSFTFSEKMTALTNGNVTVAPAGLPAHNCTSSDTQSYSCIVDISALGNDKDGTYTYSVSGSDQYGNPMSSAETLGSVLVDRTDPVISFTSALPTTVNSTTPSVTVTFSVSETPQSNPVVKLGTTKQLDTPSNVSGLQYTYIFNDLSGITDGEKTINITVKDTSLNPTSTDFTGPLFDRTAPEIITGYIYPATVNSSNDSFSIYISFNEEVLALTGTDLLTDPAWMLPVPNCFNEGNQTFRCTYNITGLDVDGVYYFYVSASDIALNSIDPDPTYVIKLGIDRTLPTATISPVTIYEQGTGNVKAGNIARAGDIVFVTVTLSEKLSETPKVRLGTQIMQFQGESCVQGVCNFARVIQPSEGDGLKNITVEMEDLVGNRKGDVFPDMVIIDVTPPQMHSNFVTPQYAKDNQVIEARFSFSEPVKVSSLQTTYAWAFTKDTVQSTDQLFVYTANSSSFASGAAINFEVKVTDPAGNPLNGGNWLSVGTTNIDKVLPVFTTNTCDVTVSSGYTNPAGIKAVKAGQTVTANCNITANETIKGNPVLKVGGYAATRQGSCPGGYNNCYIYTVAGTEGDGNKVITSEVEDLAGNITASSTGQQVSFDFTPPQLVYYNIFRTPDIEGSTEGQMIHVSA
ncbi:MAG TPA: hypothetical protein PLW37_07410, partial [bacterium]|nr:hypothetical protein [bacterium]